MPTAFNKTELASQTSSNNYRKIKDMYRFMDLILTVRDSE